MAFVVIVLIVAIALGALLWHKGEPARGQALQASMSTLQGFAPSLTLYGADGAYGLALDPAGKAVALLRSERPAVRVEAARLLGAELYRDGERIGQVYREGPAAQARLQEIAQRLSPPEFHEPTSELTRWQEVSRVELRLIIDSETAPAHDVRILDREVRDTDAVYREAVTAGEYWLAQLGALMR